MTIVVKIKGPNFKELVELTEEHFLIGRSAKCDMAINDPKISGKHCVLYLHNSKATLRDLDSTNGTRINDDFTDESHFYLDDVIHLGEFTIELESSYFTPNEKELHKKSGTTGKFISLDGKNAEKKLDDLQTKRRKLKQRIIEERQRSSMMKGYIKDVTSSNLFTKITKLIKK